MRRGHTGNEMVASGEWNKIGKKHYVHISGFEIKYDCMAWGWLVSNNKGIYQTLWAAKQIVEWALEETANGVLL